MRSQQVYSNRPVLDAASSRARIMMIQRLPGKWSVNGDLKATVNASKNFILLVIGRDGGGKQSLGYLTC
jgi:hypothetical protein